jgi:hypothetical protein
MLGSPAVSLRIGILFCYLGCDKSRLTRVKAIWYRSPIQEQAEFIINLNAAKQIGLTVPPDVLQRADKVIR